MKMFALSLTACFWVVFWPVLAAAQEQEIGGVHQHDGFFLRFHAGAGSGNVVEEFGSAGDMKFTGLAGVFRLQIGGSIADNLVAYGELGAFVISDPELEWNEISGTMEDVNLSISDFGAGLTYYFMPSNIYLSGTFTISKNKIESTVNDISASTESGIGGYLAIGKEWWVSAEWGLGVAGFYYFSQATDKDDFANAEYDIKNSVFGIVFSATFH